MNAPLRSCNAVVVGVGGRYPTHILASIRCIKFWLKILETPDYRIVKKYYFMFLYYY